MPDSIGPTPKPDLTSHFQQQAHDEGSQGKVKKGQQVDTLAKAGSNVSSISTSAPTQKPQLPPSNNTETEALQELAKAFSAIFAALSSSAISAQFQLMEVQKQNITMGKVTVQETDLQIAAQQKASSQYEKVKAEEAKMDEISTILMAVMGTLMALTIAATVVSAAVATTTEAATEVATDTSLAGAEEGGGEAATDASISSMTTSTTGELSGGTEVATEEAAEQTTSSLTNELTETVAQTGGDQASQQIATDATEQIATNFDVGVEDETATEAQNVVETNMAAKLGQVGVKTTGGELTTEATLQGGLESSELTGQNVTDATLASSNLDETANPVIADPTLVAQDDTVGDELSLSAKGVTAIDSTTTSTGEQANMEADAFATNVGKMGVEDAVEDDAEDLSDEVMRDTDEDATEMTGGDEEDMAAQSMKGAFMTTAKTTTEETATEETAQESTDELTEDTVSNVADEELAGGNAVEDAEDATENAGLTGTETEEGAVTTQDNEEVEEALTQTDTQAAKSVIEEEGAESASSGGVKLTTALLRAGVGLMIGSPMAVKGAMQLKLRKTYEELASLQTDVAHASSTQTLVKQLFDVVQQEMKQAGQLVEQEAGAATKAIGTFFDITASYRQIAVNAQSALRA